MNTVVHTSIRKSKTPMQAYEASSWQRCKNRGIRPLRQSPNGHASMPAWLVARRNKNSKRERRSYGPELIPLQSFLYGGKYRKYFKSSRIAFHQSACHQQINPEAGTESGRHFIFKKFPGRAAYRRRGSPLRLCAESFLRPSDRRGPAKENQRSGDRTSAYRRLHYPVQVYAPSLSEGVYRPASPYPDHH